MYHIKNDKRAQASSELICAGLLACMKEKPFARITITDVQHASTVSRSTFYRNFDCLEDVLALLCDRGFQAVFTEYNALPPAQRGSLAKAVFQYWFRNSAVLEALVQIHRTDILFFQGEIGARCGTDHQIAGRKIPHALAVVDPAAA